MLSSPSLTEESSAEGLLLVRLSSAGMSVSSALGLLLTSDVLLLWDGDEVRDVVVVVVARGGGACRLGCEQIGVVADIVVRAGEGLESVEGALVGVWVVMLWWRKSSLGVMVVKMWWGECWSYVSRSCWWDAAGSCSDCGS